MNEWKNSDSLPGTGHPVYAIITNEKKGFIRVPAIASYDGEHWEASTPERHFDQKKGDEFEIVAWKETNDPEMDKIMYG